jgi:hypothetical protein
MNRSALCDIIDTCTWELRELMQKRWVFVAKAAWSDDDEAYVDYIDDSCDALTEMINNAKVALARS